MIVRPPLPRDHLAEGREAAALGISQTTHSWITGELARQWLPTFSGEEALHADLLIAAALHDAGHGPLEKRPLFHSPTGLPASFRELPCAMHLDTWRGSLEQVRPISRYAALFVSKHTTHLAENQQEKSVDDFLKSSYQQQAELTTDLRGAPEFAPHLTDEKIDFQHKLLAFWDTLSLYLCGALGQSGKIGGLPSAGGPSDLLITEAAQEPQLLWLSPWPFRETRLLLRWDARVFPRRFTDQMDLDREFPSMETVRLAVALQPA